MITCTQKTCFKMVVEKGGCEKNEEEFALMQNLYKKKNHKISKYCTIFISVVLGSSYQVIVQCGGVEYGWSGWREYCWICHSVWIRKAVVRGLFPLVLVKQFIQPLLFKIPQISKYLPNRRRR